MPDDQNTKEISPQEEIELVARAAVNLSGEGQDVTLRITPAQMQRAVVAVGGSGLVHRNTPQWEAYELVTDILRALFPGDSVSAQEACQKQGHRDLKNF